MDTDLEVTFISPSSTPLVLDEEVFFTGSVKFTPTDSKDTVIDLSIATLVEDTRLVVLESLGAGGNTDRDWTEEESFLHWVNSQLLCVLSVFNLGNIFVGGDFSSSISWVSASGILSNVWIFSGELKRMGFNVGESQIHETTLATVSGGIAINDLLLRVINWSNTKLDGSGGGDSSGSGESPA